MDSEIHHEGYGFTVPSPGPQFSPVRGLASPHNQYGDGFVRIWYLADGEGTGIALFYIAYYGALDEADFQEASNNFIRGFSSDEEPRIKREEGRSVRGVIADAGGVGARARCIGSAEEEVRGRVLCVAVYADSPVTFAAAELLDGMVLR